MDYKKIPKRLILAYFSGTGCTKAVCDCFEEQLLKMGIDCTKMNIVTCKQMDIMKADILVIFSPVYAFRLTSITEEWVKNLPGAKNKSVIIISVSGGGEISPNTACRVQCKRLLKRKGYDLLYENMIVMPSNFAIQAEQNLNLGLLAVLPYKVNNIVLDILSGKKRVTSPKFQDRIFAIAGKAEHLGARFFGAFIRVSQNCNKCGLCIRNCPQENIKMADGLPKFGFRCMWCLKCIYSCPCKALSPGILKFSVLKSGFDLRKMREKTMEEPGEKEYRHYKNILWQGAIDYLCQDDFFNK